MAVRRAYRCNSCGFQFEVVQMKGEALLSACPDHQCASDAVVHDLERERAEGEARILRMVDSGIPPGNPGIRSKAMDIAQKAMENMGLTDANDSGKPGDRAAKAPAPMQTREIEEITRAMVESKAVNEAEANQFADSARSFWQGGKAGGPQRPPKLQQHINAASGAAAIAKRDGVDPMKMLHDGEKKAGGMKLDVVARAKA